MSTPFFKHLNGDWNAEPNAPHEEVAVSGATVRLSFVLNPYAYRAGVEERGCLVFAGCARWRLGSTNDEGWRAGQCRYGRAAPAWGDFYELVGDDELRLRGDDWHELAPLAPATRHFLFYLRDSTFECLAADWHLERDGAG